MYCSEIIIMDIRPNHTIYINNVNDKIKKEGKVKKIVITCLRTESAVLLWTLFSSPGSFLQSWRDRCTPYSRSLARLWTLLLWRLRRWGVRRLWSLKSFLQPPMPSDNCRDSPSTTNPWSVAQASVYHISHLTGLTFQKTMSELVHFKLLNFCYN